METPRRVVASLVVVALLAIARGDASAQRAGMAPHMSTSTLFLAQLDGKQVVGQSSSLATGTGAFQLDPRRRSLSFHLTYQGLEAGGPQRIALHNFGAGKNGRTIEILCGEGAQRCPSSASATIEGTAGGEARALDNALIGEFDSGRVYVEIVGGNGKPEIRGQLGFNGAMVRVANFVAHLAPVRGSISNGTGTAIVSETYLPGGKIAVFYALTVAGTSGVPTSAALVRNPASPGAVAKEMVLLRPQLRASRDPSTGGTLTGAYDVNGAARDALFVSRFFSAGNGSVGLVVTTARNPGGELVGELVPVR
jgi:hypothetical protein